MEKLAKEINLKIKEIKIEIKILEDLRNKFLKENIDE